VTRRRRRRAWKRLAFLLGALVLGIGTSWAATALWNRAAAVRLPVALAGQLVVIETVAGTAYSYAHRLTTPEPPVLAGAALLTGGALLATRRLGSSGRPTGGNRGAAGCVPLPSGPTDGGTRMVSPRTLARMRLAAGCGVAAVTAAGIAVGAGGQVSAGTTNESPHAPPATTPAASPTERPVLDPDDCPACGLG
jgi:hypothetical protein